MQKLEEILHAEDAARYRLAEAREQVDQIAREAAAEAELIHTSSKRETAVAAVARREVVIAEAEARADVANAEAVRELEATIALAKTRMTQATDMIVRELME